MPQFLMPIGSDASMKKLWFFRPCRLNIGVKRKGEIKSSGSRFGDTDNKVR
jgi:hypothetical protein